MTNPSVNYSPSKKRPINRSNDHRSNALQPFDENPEIENSGDNRTAKQVSFSKVFQGFENALRNRSHNKNSHSREFKVSSKTRHKRKSRSRTKSKDNLISIQIETPNHCDSKIQRRYENQRNISDKLKEIYANLCDLVDDSHQDHNEKMKEIGGVFMKYVSVNDEIFLEKFDEPNSSKIEMENLQLSSKILNFFSVYSKMNIDSFVYTRKLMMDALRELEGFISTQKEILTRYIPNFFMLQEKLTIVDAVDIIVTFSKEIIKENERITNILKVSKSEKEASFKLKAPHKSIIEYSSPPYVDVDVDSLEGTDHLLGLSVSNSISRGTGREDEIDQISKKGQHLKAKLRLEIPDQQPGEGFHDQFLKLENTFSKSWRDQLKKEKTRGKDGFV